VRLDHLLSKEHLGELRFSKREPLAGICSAAGQLRVEHYIEFLNKSNNRYALTGRKVIGGVRG
jgi:hypothetical protein